MIRLLNFIKSFWIPFTMVILVSISVLSLLPLDKLPPAPGNDKFQHFLAYAVLVLPTALRKPRRWIVLCIAFVAFSGLIELVQPLVNRYCDVHDLLANSFGVLFGVIVAGLINVLSTAIHDNRMT